MKLKGAAIMMAAVLALAIIVGVVTNLRYTGETDTFNSANFVNVRSELTALTADTSHGLISVNYIEHLNDNFYNRFSFSHREKYTAVWIVEELLAMGYTWDNIEVQEFAWDDIRHFHFWTPLYDIPDLGSEYRDIVNVWGSFVFNILLTLDRSSFANFGVRASRLSQNVILTVPGQSDKKIIVGAHYDSLMFPGASDNASGTALLLESAQRMRSLNNYHTIVYIFFGAEEMGLFGAGYFTESLTQQQQDNILFMVNADVLIEGPDIFYGAGFDANGRSGANHITEIWDNIATDLNARYEINLNAWPNGIFSPSDHLAFLPHGHTVMNLIGMDAVVDFSEMEVNWDFYMLIYEEMFRVLHSRRDCFHYINKNWPGKIDANMRAFSLFLEEILLAVY